MADDKMLGSMRNHLHLHQQQQQRFTLDARSLATFRILLGLYLLYDLWARLSLGKYDLAWYTQDPRERSYLDPRDTPHQAPMHRIWFHRGSQSFQIAAFGLSGILSLCFCLGYHCWGIIKGLLWIVQVSQVSRNMYLSDGSDSFIRHLLLWSCFLPVSKVWSLDAYTRRSRNNDSSKPKRQQNQEYTTVSGLPCFALMLQICFMYWGTVFHRTLDIFPWSQLDQSQWLPPKLSAVHYALAGSFATRDNFLTQFLRSSPRASAFATLGATIVEVVAPLACLLVSPRYRHWFALQLFALHLGLYATLNLPNWQFVGMLATVIWIPSHVWDKILLTTRRRKNGEPSSVYKKTDGDATTSASSSTTPSSIGDTATTIARGKKYVSRFLQCFFFLYMIYNWIGNRGWIRKHDGGDIGEGLRLSQYWVMYSQGSSSLCCFCFVGPLCVVPLLTFYTVILLSHGKVGDYASITALTGRVIIVPIENDNDSNGNGDDKNNATRIQPHRRRIDLYHYIRTKQIRNADPADYIPPNMTNLYPSPRWERILHQWASQPYKHTERAREFIKVLCTFINEDLQNESSSRSSSSSSKNENVAMQLTEIEMTWRNLDILPPGSSQRYAETRPQLDHTVKIDVQCSEDVKK